MTLQGQFVSQNQLQPQAMSMQAMSATQSPQNCQQQLDAIMQYLANDPAMADCLTAVQNINADPSYQNACDKLYAVNALNCSPADVIDVVITDPVYTPEEISELDCWNEVNQMIVYYAHNNIKCKDLLMSFISYYFNNISSDVCGLLHYYYMRYTDCKPKETSPSTPTLPTPTPTEPITYEPPVMTQPTPVHGFEPVQPSLDRVYYYHGDHLGSSTYVTDNNGRPVAYYDYLPFGEVAVEHNQTTNFNNGYKFNAKELDEATGMSYYGARYYDSRLSIFVSVDPLAEETMTPYQYCSNNPINRIDPTGMVDNPIYDTDGNFLGTDDKGLQGKAIVMNKENFTQGMSHQEALSYNLGAEGLNEGGIDKLLSHKSTLSSRIDWKGYVTFGEAIDHYHYGNGEPLYVDLSKINFKSSRLSVDDFTSRDTNSLSVNFFMTDTHPLNSNILWYPGESKLGNVFGTLRVNLESLNGTISLQNYERYGGGFDRFDFNRADQFIADRLRKRGNPTPYNFYGYGKGSIILTKPKVFTLDNPGLKKPGEF